MVLGRGGWPCAGSGLAGAGGVAAGAGGVACFRVGAGCFPRPPIVPRAPSGVKALRPLQGGPCGPGLDPGRCPPGIGSDQGKGGQAAKRGMPFPGRSLWIVEFTRAGQTGTACGIQGYGRGCWLSKAAP